MIPRKEINMVTDMGKWKQSQVIRTVIRNTPASLPLDGLNKNKMQLDLNIIFVLSLSNFKFWFFKTFKNAQGIRHHEGNMHFFTVCLYNLKCNPSLQAYADYMGFVLSLNKVVKGKKLTCEYKVSEVFNLSLLSVDSKSSVKILSCEFLEHSLH